MPVDSSEGAVTLRLLLVMTLILHHSDGRPYSHQHTTNR